MQDQRLGGSALIAGAIGMIVTMTVHPSGADLLVPGQLQRMTYWTAGAHALGIASMCLSFLGSLALAKHLSGPGRLALAGLVAYGLALAAGAIAASVSGFVAPSLMAEIASAADGDANLWRTLLDYNHRLNQAAARVLVVASSAAIVLWSAAIVRSGRLPRGVGVFGWVMAPAVTLALLSGHLQLGIHGFGLVVLAQSIWFVLVGALLFRSTHSGPS